MKKNNKPSIVLIVSILFNTTIYAQFISAEIGVDGLTCSQCQRGVEMSVRKLDFVQDIQVNLEHTNGKIIFKPGAKVNMNEITKAVTDAGFSMRFLNVNFIFNNLNVSDNFCFLFEGNNYQFIKSGNQLLNGEKTIKIVGKNFVPKKEYKTLKNQIVKTCDKSIPSFFVML